MMSRRALLVAAFALSVLPLSSGADEPTFEDADPVGKPKTYKAGSGKYAIWHDKDGWHFRATAKKDGQEFTGQIDAVDGKFTSVKLITSGSKAPPAFDTKSKSVDVSYKLLKNSESGFDLKVDDKVTAVRFKLKVDGREDPELILIGAKGTNPRGAEFLLPPAPMTKKR